ncbi:hypothetical protein P20495_1737 [Pseudoalteromonas sp. BSi20495]|nr:hypothetical protein P20495_1737 [Pseudoalteromonas sp. BSi20495]
MSIARVKQGKNTDGSAWKEPKKKRIFTKINQKKRTYIKTSGVSAEIGYKSSGRGYAGAIAKAHSRGLEEKFSVERSIKNLKKRPRPDYGEGATLEQARRLKALGYKMWSKDMGKYVRVTQGTIMQKLSFGKAGLIIALLKAEEKEKKKQWSIKRPERELLGNTPVERSKIRIAELEKKMYLNQK